MSFLSFQKITKRFPGVLALDNVSFEIERGSCHALIGENGAGKSTLGKILAGVYTADDGQIILEGKEIHPIDPMNRRAAWMSAQKRKFINCSTSWRVRVWRSL